MISRRRCILWVAGMLTCMLIGCQSMGDRDTIAKLRHVRIDMKEERIEGGLDKAMQSYQRFLDETPDAALAPEAIRRLADLKIEKEYGTLTDTAAATGRAPAPALSAPEKASGPKLSPIGAPANRTGATPAQGPGEAESEADFEKRATRGETPIGNEERKLDLPAGAEGADDLERAGALEAVALYQRLLDEYPLYDRNDQVLYQMSRAYEELGRIPEAMAVMDRLVREFPQSHYVDEVQFRRAEFFFAHRRFLEAEEAYASIVDIGVGSFYYELALYKLGWTFYKQELYEDALHRFIALLDYKVATGTDFETVEDETERKRLEDTFRVISLGFSNLGGAESVVAYFGDYGQRSYEDRVYSHLAEFYFDKRRYADASATYNAFVDRNPFHKSAPNFHMRVIEIHTAGGFPTLVLDAKKAFARNYGLKAPYWEHFDPAGRPEVLDHLKTNLKDLATHYHACYQDKRQKDDQPEHFEEALHWYREFLASFPADEASPMINYRLADLLFENRSFGEAAVEYEKTAYGYPADEKSSAAGYAAVYAYREALAAAVPEAQDGVKREVVRSSLKFADTFPAHEKAAVVLGAAADDLYVMKAYQEALAAANKLLATFPQSDTEVLRAAHLVVGHASYELLSYGDAEAAYMKVLALLPQEDKSRPGVIDNLAASIYKQGEQANAAQDYRAAADHFLRVGRSAPTSKLRANAEYDGAAALIQLKDWPAAAAVLVGFRDTFPDHPLQPEVTKKIAYVYRENGQLSQAAAEYERIETEATDEEIRREALLVAAELYAEDHQPAQALTVYRRYVAFFPQPVEIHLETRNKIADILKTLNDRDAYMAELAQIVAIEADAGAERTPRTRFIAASAALVLAEADYERFTAVQLVKPFEKNLRTKRDRMKSATRAFNALMAYEIGETTAAATYYLAEIYAHFCKSLLSSERPEGLDSLELEEYELAIEEQAYPFEEQAITVHTKNLELIAIGVYNRWVDKSLQKLAALVPARYDKPEDRGRVMDSLEGYVYEIVRPAPQAPEAVAGQPNEASGSEAAIDPDGGAQAIVSSPGPMNEPVAESGETPVAPETGETTESAARESVEQ